MSIQSSKTALRFCTINDVRREQLENDLEAATLLTKTQSVLNSIQNTIEQNA